MMSEAWTESKPPPLPHPLRQIAESASHKLLLKQWLKEEELLLRRVALRETRLDAARRETTGLFCAFFVFHSTALLLLFSSSASASDAPARACRRSWIPCILSLLSSLGLIWAVRYKSDTEKVLERMLEREKEDALLLGKCVRELRKKGAEFDLLKEVDALRRAKSLRVEAKAAVRRWSGRDLGITALFAAACGAVALTRFVLCS